MEMAHHSKYNHRRFPVGILKNSNTTYSQPTIHNHSKKSHNIDKPQLRKDKLGSSRKVTTNRNKEVGDGNDFDDDVKSISDLNVVGKGSSISSWR